MTYYDREGRLISMREWAVLFEKQHYQRVADDTLSDGRWVSTVWLGLAHGFDQGRPLIFETMVFPARGDLREEECYRHATEGEARRCHQAIVERDRAKANEPPTVDPPALVDRPIAFTDDEE